VAVASLPGTPLGEKYFMEAKLYVGNLPYTTIDADLENLFSQAGTVKSAQVIKDRVSGRSKGFAFVEMSTADEAQAAINKFNGQDFGGRALTVNLARPREERSGGGGYRSGGGGRKQGSGGGDRRRDY
jgi:cold-inducible RNA-binding protein